MEQTTNEILTLVKKKMTEQGGYSREAYKQFVGETIEYFQEKGKLTDDDNLEFLEKTLLYLWPQVKEELTEK